MRLSATSVLDVGSLEPYYNRLDVFVSFTDDGEYDLTGKIDKNIRPDGIFAYPINDVVGRASREGTIYGRVFRHKTVVDGALNINQYRMDDFDKDKEKLEKLFPEKADDIDYLYTIVPGLLNADTAFARLWMLTYRVSLIVGGRSQYKATWAVMMRALGYDSVIDKVGRGIISKKRTPCLIVFDIKENNVEDLEVVSTQANKKEINSRIASYIARFNATTKVSNARNRIKKW